MNASINYFAGMFAEVVVVIIALRHFSAQMVIQPRRSRDISGQTNVLLSRIPRYLGAECILLVFLSVKSMWSLINEGNLVLSAKSLFLF